MKKYIKVSRDDFISRILSPVLQMGNICCIVVENDVMYCSCSASDTSKSQIAMLAECNIETDITELTKINIGNPKKYMDILKMVNSDYITLYYDGVSLMYSSESNQNTIISDFRFILLNTDNNNLYDKETFDKIEYNTTIELFPEHIKMINQTSSSLHDIDKLYIKLEDEKVFVVITDKTYDGSDEIKILLSSSYQGDKFNELIISKDILSYVCFGLTSDVKCIMKISKLKIVSFEKQYYNNEKLTSRVIYVIPTRVE